MRTTIDLPDELFYQLKARAVAESISLKLLIEKTGYSYLREPLRQIDSEDVVLPIAGDGSGTVVVDPANWWDEINERS